MDEHPDTLTKPPNEPARIAPILHLSREQNPHQVPPDSVLHWRIYYRDGRMVSSKDCAWEQAPSTDIVAVAHALNDEPADCELGTPYYWHNGDWIGRVWDATLYLRATGRVKFGRWADHNSFNDAWREALRSIAEPKDDPSIFDERSMRSGCVFTTRTVNDAEVGQGWSLYYDNHKLFTHKSCAWADAPADGILCATYSSVYSGMQLRAAMRRYTYYYWRGHELINTDDLDEVLTHFPQCKHGQPAFAGKSYRHQAEALSQAIKDQLEDLR